MTRTDDWSDALEAVFAVHARQPFTWGAYDCGTLMADAVQAVTGEDPFAALRGYTSSRAAYRRLVEAGHHHILDAVDAAFPRVAVGLARRGDLVAWETARGEPLVSPAVVIGTEAVSRAEADNWILTTTLTARTAWRVG